MTKRYSILQKKLQELESLLNDVLSRNPLDHYLYSQDIEQRFEFLRTLLSAEITSSPEKPQHLQHIAKRLSELETIFGDWQEFNTTTNDHHLETVSACSCTESCLNDDGEATFEVGSCGLEEEKENFLDGLLEKNKEEVNVEEIGELKTEHKGSVGVVGWPICASFGVGLLIGMALMGFILVNVCECFSFGKSRMCYTPT